ncbi:hypothetical protein [Jiangella muralis]|uniref:hypothetical protein n=1 Tax=Jiangella muralis TaxID=702383 RepID=UPI00069F34A4|nr:hypothetical protein [Jiangella muralis]
MAPIVIPAPGGRGLLTAYETVSSSAGGPPRVEYELTDAGEREYLTLLGRALAAPDAAMDVLAAAVGLIEDLPRDEALRLLRELPLTDAETDALAGLDDLEAVLRQPT